MGHGSWEGQMRVVEDYYVSYEFDYVILPKKQFFQKKKLGKHG